MLSTPGDVVHQECSCSASVIRPGDRSERLLACLSSSITPNLSDQFCKQCQEEPVYSGDTHRIPYLKLDLFAIYIDHSGPKFNTNSEVMYRLKSFISEL